MLYFALLCSFGLAAPADMAIRYELHHIRALLHYTTLQQRERKKERGYSHVRILKEDLQREMTSFQTRVMRSVCFYVHSILSILGAS